LIAKIAVFTDVPNLAEMVALVAMATPRVEILNVAVEEPDGIVTLAGTVALRLLDFRVITNPAVGAVTFIVTVPVAEVPPSSDVGDRVKVSSCSGLMARTADLETKPYFAEIVVLVATETPTVVMLNVAELLPAGIVTVDGTVASTLLDFNDRVVPSAPAATFKVTVPVAEVPPRSEVGDRDRDSNVGTSTPRSWVMFTPP